LTAAATALVLVHTLCLLAVPLVVARSVDALAQGRPVANGAIAALAALAAALAAAGGGRRWATLTLGARCGRDLRRELFGAVPRLQPGPTTPGAGELIARGSSDIQVLETMTTQLPLLGQAALIAVGGLIAEFILSPLLAGLMVAVLGLGALAVVVAARPLHGMAAAYRAATGRFSERVEQAVSGMNVIKGHGLDGSMRDNAWESATSISERGRALGGARARFITVFLSVPALAVVSVLAVSAWLVPTGRESAGTVVAFLQYMGLLLLPIQAAAQLMVLWPQAAAAGARLSQALSAEPPVRCPATPRPLLPGPGRMTFDKVSLTLGGRTVLQDLSLDLRGGTTVALVGPAGSGKTSLLALAARLRDPDDGLIELDGVPLSQVCVATLRDVVVAAPAEALLFAGLLTENVRMGSLDDASSVERALSISEAGFALTAAREATPGVALTALGGNLSGGQRQRVALARALLPRARVILLDEPTSALDPDTERKVAANLQEALRGRTALIATNRPATAMIADEVVLLDAGRLVARGSHDQLASRGEYRVALGLDHP
jgi:ATP-binding cassette subfamily B protein